MNTVAETANNIKCVPNRHCLYTIAFRFPLLLLFVLSNMSWKCHNLLLHSEACNITFSRGVLCHESALIAFSSISRLPWAFSHTILRYRKYPNLFCFPFTIFPISILSRCLPWKCTHTFMSSRFLQNTSNNKGQISRK